MAKSTSSTTPDSTIESSESQVNSAPVYKAQVYSQLRNLTKFDAIIFKKMSANAFPGARKTLADWDAFVAEYQNGGTK